jgi:sulfide:quinone oxidoreductase
MAPSHPLRVVVAGGGIATLELLLALRASAGAAVDVTVVAPGDRLAHRPESVAEPFDRAARHYALGEVLGALGARHVDDRVAAVAPDRRTASLAAGGELEYDALVVAAGTRGVAAFEHATTFRPEAADELHWAIRELEEGSVRRIAFVAPPGSGWTLPVYELALLTAARARDMGVREPGTVTVVTHEPAPLQVLRGAAADAVGRRLQAAGVTVLAGREVLRRGPGTLELGPAGAEPAELPAERVVALPVQTGPGIDGLPLDQGFVRVDADFAVPGAPGVHAIGDAAAYPVKQGGLATQQADTVAAAIARQAGVAVPPHPFAGRIRATLWTGGAPLYLSVDLVGGEPVASDASERAPWWPVDKVAGVHLAPFLADVDEVGVAAAVARADERATRPAPDGPLLAAPGDPGIEPLDAER